MKKANFLWSLFSSIKITIVLLSLIIAIFIVATLNPQQEGSSQFSLLGDLYHSRLFYVLMALLSLNMIICSINRLPLSIKQYSAPYFPAPQGIFENLPQDRIILTDKKMEDVSRAVASFLASKLFSLKKTDMGKEHLLYHECGKYSVFGVYIVHLGVLIIIAGAVIGSMFGFDADINLSEGQESNVVQLTKGGGTRQLDFSVRCDKFNVDFYHTGAPKTYRSDLSFIKNGQVIYQGSVLVNHPMSFEGLRFYQSSYGLSEESKAALRYKSAGIESPEKWVTQGETFNLPGNKAKASVLRVEENLMGMGPAVKLNIETGKENVQFWVFQHIKDVKNTNPGLFSAVPLFNPGLFKPLTFSLNRIERQYYTGLQVVRDPGVPFVLTGAIMLIAGLIAIFFITHQRVWVLIRQEPEGIKIYVAGRSNRNNEMLQRQLDDLFMRMEKELVR